MKGLVLAVALIAYNNLLNLWPAFVGPLYVPFNLSTTAVLIVLSSIWLDLGLDESGLRLSIADGLIGGAVGAILLPVLPSLAGSRWRRFFLDPQLRTVGTRGLLVRALVRIPLGTALLEEVAFRGILLAALFPLGTAVAVVVSSLAFGLWHIAPTLNLARVAKVEGERIRPTGVVIAVGATVFAGLFLCLLRLWTGSISAPFVLHSAVNSASAVVAFLIQRRRAEET